MEMASSGYADIVYGKAAGVATITINRPRVYNAFTLNTIAELTAAFSDASADEEIGVIVLTGAGGNFCTGGDVSWENELTPSTGRIMLEKLMPLAFLMRNSGKPVIAKVRGYCIGGGNELNLLCDLTIAEEGAKFGQAGPKMGSVPIWHGTQLLPLLVGEKRAREIVYLCRQYTARQALEMGWVNAVVPESDLDATVSQWCEEILDKSPQAIRTAKTSINFLGDLLTPSINHGGAILALMHGTDEFHEGTDAFKEKRKPDFRSYRKRGT